MAKQRNPKGMGYYYTSSSGKKYWRRRIDGHEQYLSADTSKELQGKINEVIDLKITKSKLKVDDLFMKWLKYIKELRKDGTYKQYYSIYKEHIKPEIGKRKISSIQPSDIQDVILAMNKKTVKTRKKIDGKWIEIDTGKSISTWTMKHARKIMNGGFSYAKKEKLISSNPLNDPDYKIEIPQRNAKPRKTLNSKELAKLYRQLENSRWIWSAKFMLLTGMRRGELLALKWSDIDYVNNRITVDKSNSSTGLGDPKSKIHYIPLSKMMKRYLEGQKRMLKNECNPILVNEKLKKSNLVFPNENGVMLQPGSYYTLFARAAEKAGIHASPHMLRHTFVYRNRKKLSLKEIQNILGHDETTTTLDIYGDMIDESTEETAKTIDESFADLEESISALEGEENLKVIDFNARRKKKA